MLLLWQCRTAHTSSVDGATTSPWSPTSQTVSAPANDRPTEYEDVSNVLHRDSATATASDNDSRIGQAGCLEGCIQPTPEEVVCVNRELHHLPTCDGGNLSVILNLALKGNNLTHLGVDAFWPMNNLITLILSDNAISVLDLFAFRNLHKLTTLAIDNNRLDKVPSTQLASLRSLITLNLSRNSIRTVDQDAFSTLMRLDYLDLSHNSISNLSVNAFRGLRNLTTLDLAHNSINSISEGTFQQLMNLKTLSLSYNAISHLLPIAFSGTTRLSNLALDHNWITSLPSHFTSMTPALVTLDLSFNPIITLSASLLSPGLHLETVNFSHMSQLTQVLPDAFVALPQLRLVNLSHCPQLQHIDSNAFRNCSSLEELDFSYCGLKTLHGGLVNSTTRLKRLNLAGNKWRCDCALQWVTLMKTPLFAKEDMTCSEPPQFKNLTVLDHGVLPDHCAGAAVVRPTANVSFKVGSEALLECRVTGEPFPSVTWYTPHNQVLHWHPTVAHAENAFKLIPPTTAHLSYHNVDGTAVEPPHRLWVIENGTLYISSVTTLDAGNYVCRADNSLGNQSIVISMSLDYEILHHVKVVSIMVGLATSVAFLIAMLVAQLAQMMLNRWGWCCCCKGKLPPRARQIRKMLESVEHYKTQQLERLRENYNLQVQRIKDNGTQQLERLRESYGVQADRLRDICDYGTLQIDRMRDQYYEQVRRVRDYSVQQMNRVRENYVFQRNRIRKFSAHQLFKLRENYKVQQLHLNKILENLNLESCRTVCARTDSVMFTSEIGSVDADLVSGIVPLSIPRGGRCGSDEFDLQDVTSLMLPASLEAFEMAPLELTPSSSPSSDEHDPTSTRIVPVLFIDDDDEMDSPCIVAVHENREHTTKEVKLEEVVTSVEHPTTLPSTTIVKQQSTTIDV